jgi:hypothetical protein
MKSYVSDAAKSLITIIGTEYAMAQSRADSGYIAQDRMLGTLLERLNRLAVDNVDLRNFLDTKGFIPPEDDFEDDREWAEDPRDPNHCYVSNLPQDRAKDSANKTLRANFGNQGNRLTRGLSKGGLL